MERSAIGTKLNRVRSIYRRRGLAAQAPASSEAGGRRRIGSDRFRLPSGCPSTNAQPAHSQGWNRRRQSRRWRWLSPRSRRPQYWNCRSGNEPLRQFDDEPLRNCRASSPTGRILHGAEAQGRQAASDGLLHRPEKDQSGHTYTLCSPCPRTERASGDFPDPSDRRLAL